MTTTHQKLNTSHQFQGWILPAHPTSGTEDDDDNRDDEHAGENEAPVRAVDEGTEAPEEFDAGVNAGYFGVSRYYLRVRGFIDAAEGFEHPMAQLCGPVGDDRLGQP
jgi:hypothetical protein